ELVVRFQHHLEVVLDVPVRKPDPRAAVVGDDRRAVVQDHLGEAFADRAEAAGAEGVEVPHAGPAQDEKVDAALANPPLQGLGPGRKRRLVAHGAETSTAPETLSTTRAEPPIRCPEHAVFLPSTYAACLRRGDACQPVREQLRRRATLSGFRVVSATTDSCVRPWTVGRR